MLAHAYLSAGATAAAADDPLSREAVQSLATALGRLGSFQQAGWVLADVRAGSLRALMLPAQSEGQPILPWGHTVGVPGNIVADTSARLLRAEELHDHPVAALFRGRGDNVLLAPLAFGNPGQVGWLVALWSGAASELADGAIEAFGLLGLMLGPSVSRRMLRPSSTPPPATRVVPSLSPENIQQIAVAGRWASLGTLAGGVVHEINNPATFIALAAGQIEKKVGAVLGDDPTGLTQLTELTAGIQEATRQIRGLVGDFRQFVGGTGKSAILTVDMERVLVAACAMTKAAHRHDAVLETQVAPIPPCPGRLLSLGPATVAVLVNSIEALEDGPKQRRVTLSAHVEGEILEIVVSDTGRGIFGAHLPLVFEPFFTTKSSDAHAGLGLTVARSAVESLGGEIRVTSELGAGTRVTMRVPIE